MEVILLLYNIVLEKSIRRKINVVRLSLICLVDSGKVSVHGPSIIYASGTTSISEQRVWQSVENHGSEPPIFA